MFGVPIGIEEWEWEQSEAVDPEHGTPLFCFNSTDNTNIPSSLHVQVPHLLSLSLSILLIIYLLIPGIYFCLCLFISLNNLDCALLSPKATDLLLEFPILANQIRIIIIIQISSFLCTVYVASCFCVEEKVWRRSWSRFYLHYCRGSDTPIGRHSGGTNQHHTH